MSYEEIFILSIAGLVTACGLILMVAGLAGILASRRRTSTEREELDAITVRYRTRLVDEEIRRHSGRIE